MVATRRRWTPDDVRALMRDSRTAWPRYELLHGELFVTPAPLPIHQIAVTEILTLLASYVSGEDLGVALASPADLELLPEEITQPDVFVVPLAPVGEADARPSWADVKRLLLAVEVISPSSARSDRVDKRDHYMDAEVPEYWVVDIDARIIERWMPGRETPLIARDAFEWKPEGAAIGLAIDVAALFDRIWKTFRRLPSPTAAGSTPRSS